MTTTLTATFDGNVLVPREQLDLPQNTVLRLQVEVADQPAAPLEGLVKLIESMPPSSGPTTDGAAQHDHYLYGAPRRS